jgi:DNA-directed RNA polymerase specialized sigma24 family protein
MLQSLAVRILGDSQRAKTAVENCWRTARRRSPQFNYESEFRAWLLRVLIEEALNLRRDAKQTAKSVAPLEVAEQASRSEYAYEAQRSLRTAVNLGQPAMCKGLE